MEKNYLISIDQSTQGTKALLFDKNGTLMCRADVPHKQIVNDLGWVSHNPEEIYENVIKAVRGVLAKANVSPEKILGIGISNQRETSVLWDKKTGLSLNNAIVWQCARATEICERDDVKTSSQKVFEKTGIKLSPYFPASKIAWLIENTEGAKEKQKRHGICHGTVDSYLVYRLTKGEVYATDYSNASRTQLFNIFELKWDEEICKLFGINPEDMPKVMDSNACYGYTDFEGLFTEPIPIQSVLGDSHGALFGQGCRMAGMAKATYGTGSSIMMNIGENPLLSKNGLVTSLAWGIDGKVNYVLEGNLNYTGAVITWLKDDMELIESAADTESLAMAANKNDSLYLVPAFTGLGAPYWNSHAKAAIVGMDRTTKKKELVRAALECIAYQITDIIKAMGQDAGDAISELRVDGGPTRNGYLMQFQSDISGLNVQVPNQEELSGIGAAYLAGISLGMWSDEIFSKMKRNTYSPVMDERLAKDKYAGWKAAVEKV
ncbi:FGGY-family carbohydrate kinase [Pseudobutyrivibrio sp.]|uniref:FGGY-family carbohydrate kinase n=1 Tax=Pseudobutyrivibrio sp. TaxID=2014367 RepID=UPI001DFFE9AD|nr:glycerol kinase [Pseudobutyrivibrio sp.]MBE5910101.1 glycerol kinase GlpK [Pseudobutyrivibrio sp.]